MGNHSPAYLQPLVHCYLHVCARSSGFSVVSTLGVLSLCGPSLSPGKGLQVPGSGPAFLIGNCHLLPSLEKIPFPWHQQRNGMCSPQPLSSTDSERECPPFSCLLMESWLNKMWFCIAVRGVNSIPCIKIASAHKQLKQKKQKQKTRWKQCNQDYFISKIHKYHMFSIVYI